MEVYKQFKKDIDNFSFFILKMIFASFILVFILNYFDVSIDNTDKDGLNRSGVELITDYGTGNQYLYKSGALVPRLNKDGVQVNINKKGIYK